MSYLTQVKFVNTMTPTTQGSSTLDGLPKQFVNALRTLFDVMDDKGTGFVKFCDIETRWREDGAKGMPRGVVESLRKVTPSNGLLSFERFCAGLKICLLRNQMEGRVGGRREEIMKQRPPSAPLLDTDPQGNQSGGGWGSDTTAGSEPGKMSSRLHSSTSGTMVTQQRTLSMPLLAPSHPHNLHPPPTSKPHLYGPPKPPRVGLSQSQSSSAVVQPVDRAEIRSALHSWQVGIMMEEEQRRHQPRPRPLGDVAVPVAAQDSSALPPPGGLVDEKQVGVASSTKSQAGQYNKVNGRRREMRRHTLHNGVDYNMLKRMKVLEGEKEVLVEGLEAVDKARDWYMNQIAILQDKIQYINTSGPSEECGERERAELRRARVLEVNRHLSLLTESTERGALPLHMNLAVDSRQHHRPHPNHSPILGQLTHQNHYLQQEMNKRNERITALEREKASLMRELFHTRTLIRSQPVDNNTSYL